MSRRFAAVLLSALLLAPAWLGATGFTLPVALVPLLWVSASRDASRRAWWGMFGWATLTFVLWNAAMTRLGAVRTTNYIYLNPLVTMLTAALVIDERITPAALCGAALILSGMWLAERSRGGK